MKNLLKNLMIVAFAMIAVNQSMAQWTDLGTVVHLTTNTDLVGIGTISPTQKVQLVGGNMLLDYTNVSATTGNLFFGAPTFPVAPTPANSNGMRLSYNNGTSKNGFIDVRTTAATDGLIFRADAGAAAGTERMRINANGHVGIGATTPLSFLSIGGSGNALWKTFINNTGTGDGSCGIRVESSTPTGAANKTYSILGSVPSGTGYTYGVYGQSIGGAGTAGRTYGVYGRAGGGTSGYNYGVYGELNGTGNGTAILGYEPTSGAAWTGDTKGKWAGYFAGNTAVFGKLTVGDAGSNTGVADINFGAATSTEGIGSKRTAGGNSKGLDFYTNSLNRMRILNDGRVVIGDPATATTLTFNTTTAQANNFLLFVRKGVMTEQVFVTTYGSTTTGQVNWPDYVFEKDYNLRSLNETDSFIKENGHLPNIPSAQEVEKEGGFELKQMSVKQLEKIEEIYLHLIEMDKKITALEAENAALKLAVNNGGK